MLAILSQYKGKGYLQYYKVTYTGKGIKKIYIFLLLFRVYNTDKKENRIFLICKEIQVGSGAKSYARKGFLIYEIMRKYLAI
jgi:hypothetical protein